MSEDEKPNNDALKVRYSTNREGRKNNLGLVENKTTTWGELVAQLEKVERDPLTIAAYRELSVDQQATRKNNGWFIGGQFKQGLRQKQFIEKRQLITLDIDQGSRDVVKLLRNGFLFDRCEYFAHSTRSHGAERIKLHVVIPLPRPIDLDMWNALTRALAYEVNRDMVMVDKVSFAVAQVMYWPSTCADVTPIAIHNRGPLLDPEAYLVSLFPRWRDIGTLPRTPRERELRPDRETTPPREKHGPVGAFCRTWDVREAIEEFDLPYRHSEGPIHAPDRYTFTGGTSSNGAAVYDNGQKLESFHGSDPAHGQNNSFDLARLHNFGHLDTAGDLEKDPTKQKSYQAMVKMLAEGEKYAGYRLELINDRYGADEDAIADAFDVDKAPVSDALGASRAATAVSGTEGASEPVPGYPALVRGGEPSPFPPGDAPPPPVENDQGWRLRLDTTEGGLIKPTLSNIVLILNNVSHFAGVFAYDEFQQSVVLTRQIKSRALGIDTTDDRDNNRLEDQHRFSTRHILDSPAGKNKPGWGLRAADRDLDAAIYEVATGHKFHPVRNRLLPLKHDGKPRLDTWMSSALGTPDDEYHRQVGRLVILGAIARTFRPGCKFDFLPVFESPTQGWYKSTAVRLLALDPRWAGEMSDCKFDDDKVFVEKTRGRLVVEIGELETLGRADVRAVKNRLSLRGEQVRLSYRRDDGYFPRRGVLIGTTNDTHYLRDETGNRRFWPVKLGHPAKLKWLAGNVEQIYAEAMIVYREMCKRVAKGADLPMFLTGEAAAVALTVQEDRMIASPIDEFSGEASEWLETPYAGDLSGETRLRDVVCGRQIAEALWSGKRRDLPSPQQIASAMRKVPGWAPAGREYIKGYGQQRVYKRVKQESDI